MRSGWSLLLLLGCTVALVLMAPAVDAAHLPCACLDKNNNDQCGDPGDIAKDPTEGGYFPDDNYVMPASCVTTTSENLKGGLVLTAKRIVWQGQMTAFRMAEGVQLIAITDFLMDKGDSSVTPLIHSIGINKLVDYKDRDDNAAVAKSSIAIRAGGACTFNGADLEGQPLSGSGQIGIQCVGRIDIHGSRLYAAGIDIQSMEDTIDARVSSGVPGIWCDDPTKNLNPGKGNSNGVLDSGDFPCYPDIVNAAAIAAFCAPAGGVNNIVALNNPLVMVAEKDLLINSPSSSSRNNIEGHFHILLAAATGNLDQRNSIVTNHPGERGPAGGAEIWDFASPVSVRRYPVLKEKAFGPCTGTIFIEGACKQSPNPVRYCGVLVGTPDPACLADFVPVTSGP